MIPKTIFYCWFGNNKKSEIIQKCINSWKEVLPEYEILEINETNFDVQKNPYTQKAFAEKRWAFISDYARLEFLEKSGGIYLDTDMFVLKSFDEFLNYDLVLGKEDAEFISAGMIACTKNNLFIQQVLKKYEQISNQKDFEFITIPRILTEIYLDQKKFLQNVKVFESIYFYPFSAKDINKFNYKNAPEISFAVHLWNYSWGTWYIKLLKILHLHHFLINILNKLGIKNILKKLLKVS
jgi:mannosyltransferase OCH1-like enzyme